MKKFKKLYVEITNVCNLACSFCPVTKREAAFMDESTFCKVLDQLKPHGEYLYFHVKGEPLLHPELDRFLDISYEKGFKVNITTNGTLIRQVKDKLMDKPSLRQINFSLHSFEGNTGADMVMQVYMDDILEFIREARLRTDVIIALRLWNLAKDHNLNDLENKNREIIKRLETEFQTSIYDRVGEARGIKLGERLYLNQDYEFKWPDLKEAEESGQGFCHGLRNQAAVLADGTVVPCCLDGEGILNLGSIHEMSFSDIINSSRAENIYEGFSNRQAVEELCRKCGYRQKFGAGSFNV